MKAWEVREDGTVWPVTVLSKYKNMFGFWKVQRQDGEIVSVYARNLRSADNIDIIYTTPVNVADDAHV